MFSVKSQQQQTMINLISGIVAMGVNLAVNFFLSPYIVSTLGEEANGFTQLANNFVTYASLITIAFNSVASRFMTIHYHQGNKEKVKEYYVSTLVCNILICLILIPIAFYIVLNLNRLISISTANVSDVQILFGCVFVNFFVNLFLSLYGMSMFVTNTIYIQNILNLFRYLLNAVLLFCAFWLLPARLYYVSLVAVILTTLLLPLTKKIQSRLIPELTLDLKYFNIKAIKEMLSSGIWNTINQCGNMLMTGLDLLLTNLFVDPIAMGLLSVAKTMPNAIITLATTLNSNFAPSLTINYAKGDKGRLLKELRGNMKISSVILSIPIITFCCFGTPFYRLWMPTLDAQTLTILSFLTCMAFIPWSGPQTLYNVFTATNKLKVNSMAFLSTGIINIIIVYLCLNYTSLGVFAVAGVSSTLSMIRNLVLTAPYTASLLGFKWYEFYKDVFISLGCCAINLMVALTIKQFFQITTWIILIIAVALTCVLTLILDLLFILNKDERSLILKKIRRD